MISCRIFLLLFSCCLFDYLLFWAIELWYSFRSFFYSSRLSDTNFFQSQFQYIYLYGQINSLIFDWFKMIHFKDDFFSMCNLRNLLCYNTNSSSKLVTEQLKQNENKSSIFSQVYNDDIAAYDWTKWKWQEISHCATLVIHFYYIVLS